jgi:hypothetical protein
MVSGLTPEEQAVRAVAAAVNGLPIKTQPAWHRVWARVNSGTHRTASRWPTMAGVSVFVSTLLLALHFNFVGPLHPPTVAAQTVPGPQRVLNLTATQVAAQQQPGNGSTAVPQPGVVGTPAPVPVPPGHS